MTEFFGGQYFGAVIILLAAVIFAIGFGCGWRWSMSKHGANMRIMARLARLSREQRERGY